MLFALENISKVLFFLLVIIAITENVYGAQSEEKLRHKKPLKRATGDNESAHTPSIRADSSSENDEHPKKNVNKRYPSESASDKSGSDYSGDIRYSTRGLYAEAPQERVRADKDGSDADSGRMKRHRRRNALIGDIIFRVNGF